MLEIIILVMLWNSMKGILVKKGIEDPLGMQMMVVVTWIGAQGAGWLMASLAIAMMNKSERTSGDFTFAYPIAIGIAIIAEVILFAYAKRIKSQISVPASSSTPPPRVDQRPRPKKAP